MKSRQVITDREIQSKLKEIGKKLRELRKANTANYEHFAKNNGINKVTLSRLENGENFTMSSLISVLRVLDISLDEFFSGIK